MLLNSWTYLLEVQSYLWRLTDTKTKMSSLITSLFPHNLQAEPSMNLNIHPTSLHIPLYYFSSKRSLCSGSNSKYFPHNPFSPFYFGEYDCAQFREIGTMNCQQTWKPARVQWLAVSSCIYWTQTKYERPHFRQHISFWHISLSDFKWNYHLPHGIHSLPHGMYKDTCIN